MALRSFASCARSKVALDHAAGGVPGRGSFPRDAGVAWELASCGALVSNRVGIAALSGLAPGTLLGACFMGEKGFPRCWCGGVGSGGYVLRTLDAAVRAPFLLRLAGNLPNAAVRAPKLLRLAGGPPFAAVQAPFLMHVAGGPPFAAVGAPFLMHVAGGPPFAAVRAPKLMRLANGLHACFRRFVADCSCGEHMAYTFAS